MSRCVPLLLFLLLALPLQAQQPQPTTSSIEWEIVQWTNATRVMYGLHALAPDPRLAWAARSHCQEMIALHYFAHESPTPSMAHVRDRVTAAGAGDYMRVGENIAEIQEFPQSLRGENAAERFVRGWMESPDHRENLMRPQFRTIGVGVATDGDRMVADQVFGEPQTRW